MHTETQWNRRQRLNERATQTTMSRWSGAWFVSIVSFGRIRSCWNGTEKATTKKKWIEFEHECYYYLLFSTRFLCAIPSFSRYAIVSLLPFAVHWLLDSVTLICPVYVCITWDSIRSRLIINLIFSIWQKHRMKCFLCEMASHLHNLNWHLFNATILSVCCLMLDALSSRVSLCPFLNASTHFNDSKSIGRPVPPYIWNIWKISSAKNESFTIAKRALFFASPRLLKLIACVRIFRGRCMSMVLVSFVQIIFFQRLP